jgi:phage shock protein A
MQARAGAVDELLASGALDDVTGTARDDIQSELDRMASTTGVEAELERMKMELGQGSGGSTPQIEGGSTGNREGA